MSVLKRAATRMLTTSMAQRLFQPLLHDQATVFMLHRFAWPDVGVTGHDPAMLRALLEALRKNKYRLVSLETVFRQLAAGQPLDRNMVAFTIDDGYLDHGEIGAPCFAAYDCPVTTFLTSGFLDQQLWFWWDRIDYIFRTTKRTTLRTSLDDHALEYAVATTAERHAAQSDFTNRCKWIPDAVKHAGIASLAQAAEVDVPHEAPRQYRAMTWDDVRRLERGTMSFGPHTVTHPVLSRTPDDQSRHELTEGWRRLQADSAAPVPIFCYPNGQSTDFGTREINTLRDLNFLGSVVGESGYASRAAFHAGPEAPFRVRRISYPDSRDGLLQAVSGVERFKQLLLRRAA